MKVELELNSDLNRVRDRESPAVLIEVEIDDDCADILKVSSLCPILYDHWVDITEEFLRRDSHVQKVYDLAVEKYRDILESAKGDRLEEV